MFQSMGIMFSFIAGLLDIFNGMLLLPVDSLTNEWVYVATDFSILLALVGWLGMLHSKLGRAGISGWLCSFFGFAFITGPSASIGGQDAYTIGTTVIGIGLVLLSLDLLFNSTVPRALALLLLLAVGISAIGLQPVLFFGPVVLGNIVLGFAFIGFAVWFYAVPNTARSSPLPLD